MKRVILAILLVFTPTSLRAQPVPPLVTSPQWFSWYQDLLTARLAACPLQRTTTFHFSQSGDDEAGDGSVQSPWRTLAKAQQVLDASSGDIAILFRRGDVWRETVGIITERPAVTIGDYGAGDKPLFTPFEVIGNPSGWSPVAGAPNSYTCVQSSPVSWVKEDDDFDRPYSKQSSAAEVEATEASFWWDSQAELLYIHPKHGPGGVATDPRTDNKPYELVRPSGTGVLVAGNGSRIQNIRAVGWGMQIDNVVTQEHGIESRADGNSQVAIVGCESHYGMTHCMTHYAAQGGIATFVDCKAGLTTFAAGGGETMFNTYTFSGGNQTIWDHCVATHGTLPSFDRDPARREGTGFYGHTSTSAGAFLGLTITYGCTIRDTAYGCRCPSAFSDLTPAATLQDVRCFIVGEVAEGGDSTGEFFAITLANAARVNGRYTFRPALTFTGALASWALAGWAINCRLEVDCVHQPYDFACYNAWQGATSRAQIWNCDIRATTRPGQRFSIDLDDPNQSQGSTVVNTILSTTGGGTIAPLWGPASGQLSANAYFGAAPGAAATDPHAVLLNAPPPPGRPACSAPISCAAFSLPGGFVLGFDLSGAAMVRNDIGPVESAPCANCDESTSMPVLNVNDFICFQSKFAAGNPDANCDGSTNPPLLNINDFMCFLSQFARACH